ncbi:pirin family protein [Massilia sp. S19_KUP03_FR1]|uniref:pirin family protein n=1 Tax=Massilia sp. S19_KUP03_FR1 TaxID=3025503 RepID=UPI002FCD52A4
MHTKTLKRLQPALRDDIGDLITQRPLPAQHLEQIDPFLFLNHHGPQVYPPHNHGLPFGPHPHRGFETVTFILDGMLTHQDSAGHESIIRAGGVQWMTAGSGLVHAEISPPEFLRDGGPLEILQLWVNLPPQLKMTSPAYVGLQRADIPAVPVDDGRVTVNLVAGTFEGVTGPVHSLTGVFMSTIAFKAGGKLHLAGLAERNVFLYVVRGTVEIGPDQVGAMHLAEFNDDGESIDLSATADALILLGHAEPTRAPLVAHGPFVMNSRAEINQAITDYQAGLFG